jgi:hypothetical protein
LQELTKKISKKLNWQHHKTNDQGDEVPIMRKKNHDDKRIIHHCGFKGCKRKHTHMTMNYACRLGLEMVRMKKKPP